MRNCSYSRINNYMFTCIDLTNPKTNTKNAGFSQEERDGMTALLNKGFIDSFRYLYPEKTGVYTFWSYFRNARSKNIGWYVQKKYALHYPTQILVSSNL